MHELEMLQSMMLELRKENRADHREIREELSALQGQVVSVRLWRARMMGVAAVLSAMISAGWLAIAHAMGI